SDLLRRCLTLLFRRSRRSCRALQQGLQLVDLVDCQIGRDAALAAAKEIIAERAMLKGQILGVDRVALIGGEATESRGDGGKLNVAQRSLALYETALVVRVVRELDLPLV